MNLRKINLNEDYEKFSELYKKWNLPITPKSWIPEDTFIIEKNNDLICSGSLYQLGNSAMFWIEGIISNKDIERATRKEGLSMLVNTLFNVAKEKGAEIVMSSTPRESLKNLFENNGFKETKEKYYHLGRIE